MGIRMKPDQFPEHRREDPKRAAEARVFDALQNLDLEGHGLYEFRYRKGGKQVDNPLWLHDKGRIAAQVKGGCHEMDDTGQWFLRRPDGNLERVSSPLEEAEDGCIEMRNALLEATGYRNFVAGVVIFPDMRPNDKMERVALEKHHVFIIWGLDNLQEDLERIAKEAEFRRPPRSRISENEWKPSPMSCNIGVLKVWATANGQCGAAHRMPKGGRRRKANSALAPPPSTSNTWTR